MEEQGVSGRCPQNGQNKPGNEVTRRVVDQQGDCQEKAAGIEKKFNSENEQRSEENIEQPALWAFCLLDRLSHGLRCNNSG